MRGFSDPQCGQRIRLALNDGRDALNGGGVVDAHPVVLNAPQIRQGFILAVPGRRYGEFVDILEPIHARAEALQKHASEDHPTQELMDEVQWQGLRLVVAHHPQQALEQTAKRQARIEQLRQRANQQVSKLDSQDAGKVHRGRKLSDAGVTARFFHEVSEAHLSHIIKVDLQADLFTYDIDEAALRRAQMMDGKLLLVTNVKDLTPHEVVSRYSCQVPCDYVPWRSWPLFKARAVLRGLLASNDLESTS